jgi:hypothetical protein
VIVATANKLARISWAALASGENYHPTHKALAFSHSTKWFLKSFRRSLHRKTNGEKKCMLMMRSSSRSARWDVDDLFFGHRNHHGNTLEFSTALCGVKPMFRLL